MVFLISLKSDEKYFEENPLPPTSMFPNVSFHIKTNNSINNIDLGKGGFENALTVNFLLEKLAYVPTNFETQCCLRQNKS